jgi:UDP-GlcNAc:undecaprenyl-phosphate/decaprenyl-phosphate GlcNAc-1-phosphate transferase
VSFIPTAGSVVPIIVGVFIAAAALALFATPVIRRIVDRLRIVDHPDERRVHASPLPRGGGVAVVIAFLVVGGGLVVFGPAIPGMPSLADVEPMNLLGLFGGAIAAAVFGALDDRFDLRARWQFLAQVGLAAIAVATGVVVESISNPFGEGKLHFDDPIAIGFTVVWIVGMINSLNFIDGLDGLSTGIALIAAVVLGLLSLTLQVDQPLVAVLCFALAGGLLGFLRWNFHPAVIFQGTAGVMFMGYVLGVLAILGQAKVIAAVLVLAVPIIDTFWVIVRRLSSGRSPFSPDRGHIHHRLLDVGLSHRGTVLLIYAVCATLGLMSLLVSSATGVLAFAIALVGFGVVAFALRPRAGEVGP